MCLTPSAYAQEKVTYFYTDPRGTPLTETDGNGATTAIFDYKPYGTAVLGGGLSGPGFSGHFNDDDTALVYMQARYFDPSIGRFLSIDPAGFLPGNIFSFNRNAYTNNNPLTNIDLDGRVVTSVHSSNNVNLAADINANSATQFAFDKNDQLVATTAPINPNGSSYYSSKLVGMINASTSNVADISSTAPDANGVIVDVDRDSGGGMTVLRADGSVAITISGNANTSLKDISGGQLRDTPADILTHEIVGHGAPMTIGMDSGNAVINENEARAQIPGAGQRAPEPNHVESKAITDCGMLCTH
ncbi:RHS repeat-associated protein [Luteibacter rhizovicinus]|uniref:RHS repeat-associated protein n=2 Tax=Luteibacter rhizovicinus TaxID=242606 RepID=A0A4R3YIZ0_9GAMM|nr:RHS repeat-associated protein [Luteibacter rhizovicinus]